MMRGFRLPRFWNLAAAGIAAFAAQGIQVAKAEPLIVGWSETVQIFPGKLTVRAKIDSGAKTSSIHVPNFRRFEQDGAEWVEFSFHGRTGRVAKISRPIVRIAQIKDLTGPTQSRPVIMLGVCLGSLYRETQVTLFDRSGFNFRMLLGRRFLEDRVLIDVSEQRLTRPNCPDAPVQ